MVPHGLGGERQLLRTGFRQGAGRYPEERLVSSRLARERQLLHPLRVRSCEHPGITNAAAGEQVFRRLCSPCHEIGDSTVPGLILAIMAVQLIVGRAEPVFPHFIMTQRLPTKQLLRLGDRAIHVLKYLEKAVHPRWPMTFEVEKRAIGVMVLLLTIVLLLTPVPLSNVAPAMVISLISLAYIEEDGLLLSVGFLAAIILIGLGSAAVWGAIVGAVLISAE